MTSIILEDIDQLIQVTEGRLKYVGKKALGLSGAAGGALFGTAITGLKTGGFDNSKYDIPASLAGAIPVSAAIWAAIRAFDANGDYTALTRELRNKKLSKQEEQAIKDELGLSDEEFEDIKSGK